MGNVACKEYLGFKPMTPKYIPVVGDLIIQPADDHMWLVVSEATWNNLNPPICSVKLHSLTKMVVVQWNVDMAAARGIADLIYLRIT